MALQTIGNNFGFIIGNTPPYSMSNNQTAATLNAAGESIAVIGNVALEGGSGSKTISSAGGKIYWNPGVTTFANAGTTLRVGIQDVAATGIEDTTFDVYDDLVGGTDTITASTIHTTTMSNGTKTINHGDVIAIVLEMTARGGTDSVIVQGCNNGRITGYYPYMTIDTGAGPAKAINSPAMVMIEFDDGTMGRIQFAGYQHQRGANPSLQTYNNGSATDEYAAMFQVPFKCTINAMGLALGSIASTDNFEMILYSDPLGTPVAEVTNTIDPDFTGGTGSASGPYWTYLSTAETLQPNTWYAVAARPTTANSITFSYRDYGSGGEKFKKPGMFGTNIKLVGRANQTGAFAETQTYHMPLLWLSIQQLDDGVQTGGAGGFFIQ